MNIFYSTLIKVWLYTRFRHTARFYSTFLIGNTVSLRSSIRGENSVFVEVFVKYILLESLIL